MVKDGLQMTNLKNLGVLLIPGTGNGERGTGNGERGTGNGERGTGNRERESGNECTAVIRIRIQNGGRKRGKRVWEPVLGTRSSNSIVGANNMDSKCSIY